MARHRREAASRGFAAHGLEHRGGAGVQHPVQGIDADTRFYFVHSYGVQSWELAPSEHIAPPKLTWADHGGKFLAAVENGALSATQFHPEKSGDAGAELLSNWVQSL